LKKYLAILLVLCMPFVLASGIDSLEINLYQDIFGMNSLIEGEFIIESDENVSLDEDVSASISGCSGANEDKSFVLYDLLKGNGLYDGERYDYSYGSSMDFFEHVFGDSGFVGVMFENKIISEVSFDVSGNGDNFEIDVGGDGEADWKYYGARNGFGSEEYDFDVDITGHTNANQETQEVVFDYNGLQGQIDVDIVFTVRDESAVGDLTVEVRSGMETRYCSFTADGVGSVWEDKHCEANDIPVSVGENTITVKFLEPSSGQYSVPITEKHGYHKVRVRKGIYPTSLSSTPRRVTDLRLKNSLNEIRNSCEFDENGYCFALFKLDMDSGNVKLENLELKQGDSTLTVFYTAEQMAKDVNVTYAIPLDYMEFFAPDKKKVGCELEIEMGGERDEDIFEVDEAPDASMSVSSTFIAKGYSILFDGSKSNAPDGRKIINYEWDFGDDSSMTGENVSHVYNVEGNYTARLTVTDSVGVKGSTRLKIVVGDLETYLDNEVPNAIEEVNGVNFAGLNDREQALFDGLNFTKAVSEYTAKLNNISIKFGETKASSLSQTTKEGKYAGFATQLQEIKRGFPKDIILLGVQESSGVLLNDLGDIPDYGLEGVSSVDQYKKKVYQYNHNNINIIRDVALLKIEYVEGVQNYIYVSKSISADSGDNTVLIEDLTGFDVNGFHAVKGGFLIDGNFALLPFISTLDLVYVLKTNSDDVPKSVIFTDIQIEEIWRQDCPTDDCEYKYCGDGNCDIAYEDQTSCRADCKEKKSPVFAYISLVVFVLILIYYIYFYNGPGNFKSMTGKLFKAKPFSGVRDEAKLEAYIRRVSKQGYKKGDIKKALKLRGWTEKQINYIFSRIER